ncbi:MAG: neutral/alkaline non-lysosomal ceramidase N-terminal domain-containing protein [Armatimonadota bacterium]
MQFGFGKVDITPRVGVELYGYGPYLCRHSVAVREQLYARALAASDGESTFVLVSCDLCTVQMHTTEEVRARVQEATGLPPDNLCVHCIHTHSGPATKLGSGWGVGDVPYIETLPVRLATACVQALEDLKPGRLSHAVVPCEGLGYNREDDVRPELADALREDWRPTKPEITDTEAHVLRFDGEDGLRGFASYFSCHPVVGPQTSRYIHSDYAGVATNWLEREHPGSVGLFLQGCEGNINSCVVHHSEQESLLALDVVAARYARQVRPGLAEAKPVGDTTVAALRRRCHISCASVPEEELRAMLAEREAIIKDPSASDADYNVRMATVYARALRLELQRRATGQSADETVEIQGFRLGDLVLVAAPFEIMHRYKRRIQAAFSTPVLVLSLANHSLGYAPERESFEKEDNYAAKIVPYLLGEPPFAPTIENELVEALTHLASDLGAVQA